MGIKTLLYPLPVCIAVALAACSSGSDSNGGKTAQRVFFPANDGAVGQELWVSEGTEETTMRVKDINASGSSNVRGIMIKNGIAYFSANDGINGTEPWRSDGTEDGTYMLKNIATSTASSGPRHFFDAGDTVYFTASTPSEGYELWKTDGTEAGTVRVRDINTDGSSSSNPNHFASFNGEVYFQANSGSNVGAELWKTDGTEAGTVMVKELEPGSVGGEPTQLTVFNNKLYFAARGATCTDNRAREIQIPTSCTYHGLELWETDGTEAGTVLAAELSTGASSSYPNGLTVFNNKLYFNAAISGHGRELWSYDGTNTTQISLNPGVSSSSPSNLTVMNGALYFVATNGSSGFELFKSDGTAAGTSVVKDIRIGAYSANVNNLVAVNNTLYFSADDGTNGVELWKSDGTNAGTIMVRNINTQPLVVNAKNELVIAPAPVRNQGSSIFELTQFYSQSQQVPAQTPNGNIYFVAYTPSLGREIWVSDGTEEGTTLLKDIRPDAGSAFSNLASEAKSAR